MDTPQAIKDSVTQLYNQLFFQLRLGDELRRAQRYDTPLSLILAELDPNGAVEALPAADGDAVLRRVGSCCADCVRETDTLSRSPSDGFAVLLPHTPLSGALAVAERIRKSVAELRLGDGGALRVTLTSGVGSYPGTQVQTPDELFRATEQALHQARRLGSNRVCLADPAGRGTPSPSSH